MAKDLQIVPTILLHQFNEKIDFDPTVALEKKRKEELVVDYLKFHQSVSSVYSCKIEGEEIDYDSFFKHKFLQVRYQPDYTKRADDLYSAYEFIHKNKLTKKNLLKAHKKLSKHLLPRDQRGTLRNNPMFVVNEEDRIEYVACVQEKVKGELNKLFKDIKTLQKTILSPLEAFYYAAFIHLIFLKIHPLQDGNGRTARLLEKWFLLEKLGEQAASIGLEKNYFTNKKEYYKNIKRIGLDYEMLNYSNALDFLLMSIQGMK